jgi:hypothetical protein
MLTRLLLIVSTMVLLSFDSLAQPVKPGGMVFGSPMVLTPGRWPNLVNLGRIRADDPLADLAFKEGSMLALKIDGDRQLLLFDVERTHGTQRVHHTYEAWLAGPRYHVVNVGFFDTYSSYLIDAHDGSVYDVGYAPQLSPSGDRAIIWTQDFKNGPVGPAFVDFRSRPPEFAVPPTKPTCEGRTPTFLRPTATWLDDSRVEFTGSYPDLPAELSSGKQLLQLFDGRAEWEC